MKEILNRPYPHKYKTASSVRLSGFVSLFVFLFLALFKPFGLDTVVTGAGLFIFAGFGVITGLITLGNMLGLPYLFSKQLATGNWKVKHQVLFVCWITSLIGLCNGFYFQQVMGRSFDLLFLARLMAYRILTGVILVTLLVLGRQLDCIKESLRLRIN